MERHSNRSYQGSTPRTSWLLRTLEWSEGRLGVERARLLTADAGARERLDAYVDLYVPDGHRDPH